MEVEMTVRGLMVDPVSNMPIVILKDIGGEAVLPIWVGAYEAQAIALEMEKVSTPRPMTHDLIKNVLTGLEAQVHKVVVTELKEDTFYAVIWIERGGEIVSIDSRPSDALALAPQMPQPRAGSDAADAHWVTAEDVLDGDVLAFDHQRILADGVERARAKLEYTPLAAAFCPPSCTNV